MENENKKIPMGREVRDCRMCESKELYEFLDLGLMPPADGFLSTEEVEKGDELLFPLKVAQCTDCGLTQLTYATNPQHLYGDNYRYESSITNTGVKHFLDMADSIREDLDLPKESLVVDIGSNVGVLLSGFKRGGMKVLGIDPSPKIAKIANDNGIETWQEFISPDTAKRIIEKKGLAKVVTCTNVFAHIDDKKGLMECIDALLDEEGTLVIEAPYLLDLIENMEYDTIYIDHLEYISVKPLISFFKKYGLEIFEVEKMDIHGGTLRIFVGKRNKRRVSENVNKFLELEEKGRLYEKETLDNFSKKVEEHREQFVELIDGLKKKGKKIIGISAPAKGNTLLNYCKLHKGHIDYMAEKSLIKIGHHTPGTYIPIIAEKQIYSDEKFPDYGIIFAWNFAEEIAKNNQEFLDRGGKFINPVPYPVIMENKTNENLFGAKITKITLDFEDERGIITDLVNSQINHVGLIITEPGAQRGPHYHKKSTQDSYILSGSFEVSLAAHDDLKNVTKITLNAGEMISVPSFVIHGFKAIERAVMIDMSQTRGDTGYEADVVRINLEDLGE